MSNTPRRRRGRGGQGGHEPRPRIRMREIPGAMRRGWALERERLEKLGRSVWSPSNEILRSWLLTAAIGREHTNAQRHARPRCLRRVANRASA